VKRTKPFPLHIVVFLLPATLIYTVFMTYPLLDSIRLSFFAADASGRESFVGLQNYVTLLTNALWSPRFWGALGHNFIFFLIHFLVQNPIGLLLAALLSQPTLRARSFFRTTYFLPTMLSFVIVGFIWQLILSPIWGVSKGCSTWSALAFCFSPGWAGRKPR
jgi:raffinose/stachyose/melibiose transport system permease protein